MGKHSRNKGNAFERQVAALMIEALAPLNPTKKEIYRTPMSGGHPYAQRGDLIIDQRLQPYCPFVVEAKHHKDWWPGVMMGPPLRKQEEEWIAQAKEATAIAAKQLPGLLPLLVMSGNFTGVYVAGPHLELIRMFANLKNRRPNLRFRAFQENWTLWPWAAFAEEWRAEILRRMAIQEAAADLQPRRIKR